MYRIALIVILIALISMHLGKALYYSTTEIQASIIWGVTLILVLFGMVLTPNSKEE